MSRVLVCWSPEHGQGTTFVSWLLAVAAMGKQKTLLVDANFLSPKVTTLLGIDPTHRIEQLFPYVAANSMTPELFRIHLTRKGPLQILAGMGRAELAQDEESMGHLMRILYAARSEYDLIVVDAGAGIQHAGTYAALSAADHVAVVAEPSILSAKSLRRWQTAVKDSMPKTLIAPKAGLILNRWNKKILVSRNEISDYCNLPVLVDLPDDHIGFLNALNKGENEMWKYLSDAMWAMPIEAAMKAMIGGDH